MLTIREREKLVLLIRNGKNTYPEIKRAIPELSDSDLRIASLPMRINNLSERVLDLEHIPSGDLYRYQFSDSDTFSLSFYGEELLYRLQKENEALKWSKYAAISSIIFGTLSIAATVAIYLLQY